MKKDTWIQSDIQMDEIKIGSEYLNHKTKQLSIVTDVTSNSIELFNTANKKSVYKTGQVDADGEVQTKVRLKGCDCKNWYTLDDFNRNFERVL